METDYVRKLTKDTVVIFRGHWCLLHPNEGKVYLLSDLGQFDGSTCTDFSRYRGQYTYSFWLIDKDDGDCDGRFVEICQQLVLLSLGGL